MAVQSEPLKSGPQSAARAVPPRTAGAGCLAVLGVLMLLVSVGPLFFLLNGGYSILGMAWLANTIGPYGRLFWSVASYWTFDAPIAAKAGLPLAQPVLPWLMVIGSELLEMAIILYRMRRARAGLWISGGAAAVSLFDYVTTSAGLMFAPFTANFGSVWVIWAVFALLLAAPITFGFAGLLARVLKGR